MVLPTSINGESMWLEHEHIDERDLTFLVGLRKKYGYVPNFLVSFAGKRRLPETIDQLERIITFGGSRLGRFREELIAFYVSVINECHYWMSSHGDFLRGVSGGDEELVEQVVSDPTTSKLKDADKAILSFVKKLTLVPRKVSTDDILALARVGFSDAEIMDIIQIAAYFAFCNRISEGVGLTTEDFREEWLDRLIAMRSRTHPAMFEVQDKE